MTATATWFLVMMNSITGTDSLGPLTEQQCRAAEQAIAETGATCRQAFAFTACGVDGRPSAYRACPVFDGVRVGTVPAE